MAAAVQEILHAGIPGREGAAKTPFRLPENLPPVQRSYYRRIEAYARRIRSAQGIEEIVALLDEALRETRSLQGVDALRLAEDRMRTAQSEIESLKAELQRTAALSNTDALTGLANRRGLEAAFQREAARSDRHGNPLCAALVDLDDFKAVNDTRGHAAGDAALVQFARLMQQTLRPNDVIARVGGEEFLLLLPDTAEPAAFQALTRLKSAMAAQPVEHGGFRFAISFTASVALRTYGESHENLMERLDQALYRAKHSGKNRVLFAVR